MPISKIVQDSINGGVAGSGPAFYSYANAGSEQTISQATWTKVTLGGELFDTNNNFTSSRFTPTVAGYYQINGSVGHNFTVTAPKTTGVALYKNGSVYVRNLLDTSYSTLTVGLYWLGQPLSSLVYFNGSTDYIELYCFANSGSGSQIKQVSEETYLQGVLVRAA
jgi:hypothetical protein